VKFTLKAGGPVVVRARSKGDSLVIEVEDKGIGIPAADVPRLFDRLYRSSEATAAQIPGTGLGLSIVKAIAEAHGGAVSVTSAVGVGTTMRLELPVYASPPAHTPVLAATRS
jgi:signal transduction histidine kinase